MTRAPTALTIAGSDPSGGAGIQADLKTFSALGAYGTSVITALTAQNTRAVTGVHLVPAEFVAQQLSTLVADVRVDAIKSGCYKCVEPFLASTTRICGLPSSGWWRRSPAGSSLARPAASDLADAR